MDRPTSSEPPEPSGDAVAAAAGGAPPLPALAAGRALADALHTLEGLVQGIASDGVITADEAARLQAWIEANIGHLLRPPFAALLPLLEVAIEYGRLDATTHDDLRWLCERFRTHAAQVDALAADRQRLRGFVGGIGSDGEVSADELGALRSWLRARPHLHGCWPYDELQALVDQVLEDGVVDADEQALLQAFFARVVREEGDPAKTDHPLDEAHQPLSAVAADAPTVRLSGRGFCLATSYPAADRAALEARLEAAGASLRAVAEPRCAYLVLPDAQDRAWAFTAAGRQVKKALDRQRAGEDVLVVRERDVRAALDEA